jgi:hypothetical protein
MDIALPILSKPDSADGRTTAAAARVPAGTRSAIRDGGLAALFRRPAAPTTFQRCLAVHLYYAERVSALD